MMLKHIQLIVVLIILTACRQEVGGEVKCTQIAQDAGVQGKVYVQFVVEKDGAITHVNVIKRAAPLLNQEARRVISTMPNWLPGIQKGKEVRVRYTVPINFTLN